MEARKRFSEKKVFSKSKQREKQSEQFKKFIGNKAEGQGFADKRKKKVQYEYLKLLKKEKLKSANIQPKFEHQIGERKFQGKDGLPEGREKTASVAHGKFSKDRFTKKEGFNAFSKASDEQEQRKVLKLQKKEEALQKKKERDAALDNYQKKKKDNFKKLCKKTHRGQPVMKNQIEYLLQKIEKQVNQT